VSAVQKDIEEPNPRAQLEFWVASQIGRVLQQHYPKFRWHIEVNAVTQIVIISAPSIAANKGYHLHLHRYTIDQLQKKAIAAAGEILERHGIARGVGVSVEAVENMMRDQRGNIITNDSAPEPSIKCH
jgi:predicted urease superfamily metal-dependent hydrolase